MPRLSDATLRAVVTVDGKREEVVDRSLREVADSDAEDECDG